MDPRPRNQGRDRENPDRHLQTCLAGLAATTPRVLASYQARKRLDAGHVKNCLAALQDYEAIIADAGSQEEEEEAGRMIMNSKVLGPVLQLLAHSSIGCSADEDEDNVHRQIWGSTHRVLARCISSSTCNSPSVRPELVTPAAVPLSLRLMRMGSLRCCSRMLVQAAADMEPDTAAAAGPKGPAAVSAAQLARRRQRVASSLQRRLQPLLETCLMVTGLASQVRCVGAASEDAGRARRLYGLLVSELRASQVLEHAARLKLLLLTTLGSAPGGQQALLAREARLLSINAIVLLNCMAMVTGAFLRCAAKSLGVPGTPDSRPDVPLPPWGPCCQYLALAQAVKTLAAVGFGGEDGRGCDSGGGTSGCSAAATDGSGHLGVAAGGGGGAYSLPVELVEGLPLMGSGAAYPEHVVDLRSEVPGLQVPTGTLVIHQQALEQVLSMVEEELYRAEEPADVRLGGGSGGGKAAMPRTAASASSSGGGNGGAAAAQAAQDASGDGGIRRRWTFIVSPRAAHTLCMRVAEVAIASGQDAIPGSSDVRPGPRPLLLRPTCAWHMAVRALVVARALLLGPLARPAAVAAAHAGGPSALPLLPAEYWGAVVRLLRLPAAPSNANEDLLHTCATMSMRTMQMLALPGLSAEVPLAGEPPESLAVALSAGLLPALERCMRFHWRSPDSADADVCGCLLASLICQPNGLANVLAFGSLAEVESLVATVGKLLHSCVDQLEVMLAGSGVRGGSDAAAAADWGRAFGAAKSAVAATRWGAVGAKGEMTVMYMRRPDAQVEAASVKACDRLAQLALNTGTALRLLYTDPRVAALSRDGPKAVSPQLRVTLSLVLQRWLPGLTRCVDLAWRVPELGASLREVAVITLAWTSIAAWGAVGPGQPLPPAVGSGEADGAAPAGAPSGAADDTGPSAEAGVCSWHRWLQQQSDSSVPVLVMVLTGLGQTGGFGGEEASKAEVILLLDCLLAAIMAQPQRLHAEVRAAAARVDGSAGSSGSGARTSRAADQGSPEARWIAGLSGAMGVLPSIISDIDALLYACVVMAALQALCAGLEKRCGELTAEAAQHLAGQRRLAAALLPPAEPGAAAGQPAGCSNPRCANLGADSEVELAAAGLRTCGGCGAARYCCRECQRAHWRAGHSDECGGGVRRGAA